MRDDDTTPVATNDPPAQPTPPTNPATQPVDPNANPMVPTTPMQPLQPNQPQQPQQQPQQPEQPQQQPSETPDPVEPTEVEQPEEPTTTRRGRRGRGRSGPSPADEARARGLVATGMGAARRNDFDGAVAALRQAQSAVGRRSPITRELQNELSRRGSNQVGILLQQGNCGGAQRLYRQLQSVGAAGNARSQFGDWCPAG